MVDKDNRILIVAFYCFLYPRNCEQLYRQERDVCASGDWDCGE